MKRRFLFLTLAILIIIALAGCTGGSAQYELNKPFTIGDTTFTVTFVDGFASSVFSKNGLSPVLTDNTVKFVTVVVEIKNNAKAPLETSTLKYDKSVIKDNKAGLAYNVMMNTSYSTIDAGGSKTIGIVFTVKKDATDLSLELSTGGTDMIKMPLTK